MTQEQAPQATQPPPHRVEQCATLSEFRELLLQDRHILAEYPQLLFQQMANKPDATAPAEIAELLWTEGKETRPWLKWINKLQKRSPCMMSLYDKDIKNLILQVLFSLDGKFVISLNEHCVKIWDMKNGKIVSTFGQIFDTKKDRILKTFGQEHGTYYRFCDLSANGKLFTYVKGCHSHWPNYVRKLDPIDFSDGDTIVWDLSTEKKIAIYQGGNTILAISPNGKNMLGWTIDKQDEVRLLNSMEGLQRRFSKTGGYDCRARFETAVLSIDPDFMCHGFFPDGSHVAFGAANQLDVFETRSGAKVVCFNESEGGFCGSIFLAFSPDGRFVAWGTDRSNSIIIWDTNKRTKVLVISGCTSLIISVAFSPDGRLVSTGTNDGSIGLWEVGSERQICFQYPGENAERPFSFSFCADGRSVVSSSKNAIKIWSVKKWFHYATQEKGSDEIARSSDRKVGTVKVFDMTPYSRTLNRHRFYEDDPGRPLIELEGYRSAIRDGEYIFSPDRARLLIRGGGQPPGLDLWDVSKERKLGRIPYNFTDTILFTFSQDGRFIYIVENFRLPWVWDALDGREICSFSGGRKSSCDYATLSPDGRAIATSGRRSFEISLISKMAIPIELNGHEKDRKSLSYLPDGRSIVLVSESRTVLVLDIQRNSVIMRFPAMDYWFGNVEYDVINNYLLVKHSEGQDVLVLEPMPGVSDYPIITPLRLYLFRECRWDSHITACCLRCGKRFVVPKDKIAAIRSFEKQCHLSKSQIPCLSLSPQAWLDKRMIVHCPHCEGVMRLNPFVVENNKKRIAIWWQKIRFKEYIIRKTSRLVVWRAGLIAKYFSGKN